MAVDDEFGTRGIEQSPNGLLIDIHDLGFRPAGLPPADAAIEARQGSTHPGRTGELSALPVRVPDARAESLVVGIIGTQDVAVQQRGSHPAQILQQRLLDPAHTATPAVVVAEQEVAIPDHETDFDARGRGGRKRPGDSFFERTRGVIANPDFEQVAENQQLAGIAGRAGQKGQELFGDVGTSDLQVQVGDDQRVDRGADDRGRIT